MENKDLKAACEPQLFTVADTEFQYLTDGGIYYDSDLAAAYIAAAGKVYGTVLSEDEIEPDEGLIEEVGR